MYFECVSVGAEPESLAIDQLMLLITNNNNNNNKEIIVIVVVIVHKDINTNTEQTCHHYSYQYF